MLEHIPSRSFHDRITWCHHRLAPPLHLRSFDSAFCSINYIGLKKEYLTAPPAKPYFYTKTANFTPSSTYIHRLHLLAPPSNFGVRVMMVRVRVRVDFRLWSHVWDKLCNTFISLFSLVDLVMWSQTCSNTSLLGPSMAHIHHVTENDVTGNPRWATGNRKHPHPQKTR